MRYLIVVCFSFILQAQTLQEVIEYSFKHNYQLQILQEEQEITETESDIDALWSDPILKIGINDIQSDKPLNRNEEAMQNQFISLSQTIPLSNKLKISSNIDKEKIEVIEEKKEILKVDIAFTIRKDFIKASYAQNSLDILEKYISFLQTPMNLLVNLSAVDSNNVEEYIKTELLQKNYKLKLQNFLENIEIAKEEIELVGNIKIDSFDNEAVLKFYDQERLETLLDNISTDNPRLKMVNRLKVVAKKNLLLANAKKQADITVTSGVYQRFDRNDYISVAVSYPLFIHNRQSKQKIQAIKRVNIQNITYNQTKVKLEQSLKIYLRKLKTINQELIILDEIKIKIKKLIQNAKSELSVGGSLVHYYELFTKKTDNLLALNKKELEKALIQNQIMRILGETK